MLVNFTRVGKRVKENIISARELYSMDSGLTIIKSRDSLCCSTEMYLRVSLRIINAIKVFISIKIMMYTKDFGRMM
jgi:hypothetical protein